MHFQIKCLVVLRNNFWKTKHIKTLEQSVENGNSGTVFFSQVHQRFYLFIYCWLIAQSTVSKVGRYVYIYLGLNELMSCYVLLTFFKYTQLTNTWKIGSCV